MYKQELFHLDVAAFERKHFQISNDFLFSKVEGMNYRNYSQLLTIDTPLSIRLR